MPACQQQDNYRNGASYPQCRENSSESANIEFRNHPGSKRFGGERERQDETTQYEEKNHCHMCERFSYARKRMNSTAGLEYEQRMTRRSEEHTSELQSLMRISYAGFCLKKKKTQITK